MNVSIEDFIDTEIHSSFMKDYYLELAEYVLSGNSPMQEMTGNAYHVKIDSKIVEIENTWDESLKPIQIDLRYFIDILTAL